MLHEAKKAGDYNNRKLLAKACHEDVLNGLRDAHKDLPLDLKAKST